jgi:hypothetical protein
MTFVLGFLCGICVGACFTAVAYNWLDGFADPERGGPWRERTCPPCDGDCQQGRNCPGMKL